MNCFVCGASHLDVELFHESIDFDSKFPLCGIECQTLLYNIDAVVINPTAHNTGYRNEDFYKDSAKQLSRLKRDDVFAFLCLSHYGQQSAINQILFLAKGDWSLIDKHFDIIPNFKRMRDPRDSYDQFSKFYESMLQLAPQFKHPFTDKTGKRIITNKTDLLKYYPEMKPYLDMKNKVMFVRLYISAIQGAILGMPGLKLPFKGFRGYGPLNVPDSLSMDVTKYKPGDRIINWGLGSISLISAVSAGFARSDLQCCMMEVSVPQGFPVLMITSDKNDTSFPGIPTAWRQLEILTPAGTIYELGKRLGKKPYRPFNQPGKTIMLETIKVKIVGVAFNSGYITPEERKQFIKTL